jgi:hypothetical protein
MIKMTFVILLISVITFSTKASASINIKNESFETGDFTGWYSYIPSGGSANVITSHFGDYTLYTPVTGNYFAVLKTNGPGSYTRLTQPFYLVAGQTIEGYAAFDARDYLPFNDNAMVIIRDIDGIEIARPWYSDVSIVGDYGDGSWTFWSWTATTTGWYSLEYRVANDLDSIVDSYALFDSAIITHVSTLIADGGEWHYNRWGKECNGTVTVSNDATNLYVTYIMMTYQPVVDLYINETHLYVAETLNEIPTVGKWNNPKLGKFEEVEFSSSENRQTYTYTIALADIGTGVSAGDTVFIAAHAVVTDVSIIVGWDGETPIYWTDTVWAEGEYFNQGRPEGGQGNWAMYFEFEIQ